MNDTISVIGFDSAWTDKPKAPGALSIIRCIEGISRLRLEPTLTSFGQALEIINEERSQVGK